MMLSILFPFFSEHDENILRKTQRGAGFAYTSEDLQRAVDDVKNGNKTTRGAAILYNVPRSTVKHYVLGRYSRKGLHITRWQRRWWWCGIIPIFY